MNYEFFKTKRKKWQIQELLVVIGNMWWAALLSVFTAIGKVFFCVFRKILRKQEKVIIRQSCHFPEFQEISSGSEVLTDCRGQVSNATHIGIHVLKVTNYLQIWVSEKSLVHSSENSRKSQEKKTKK